MIPVVLKSSDNSKHKQYSHDNHKDRAGNIFKCDFFLFLDH